MLFCFLSSMGQVTRDAMTAKRDSLLKRAKIQKSGAYIPISFGSASIIGGIIVLSKVDGGLEDLDKALGGFALGVVGVGVLAIGIVQLIHASNNLKRADRLTVELNKPVVINTGFNYRVLPYSVGLKIPIN